MFRFYRPIKPTLTISFRMLSSRLLFFGIASYIYTSSARTINSRNALSDFANADDIISRNSIEDYVCSTPGCVRAAGLVMSILDESVDPCEDFYRFACGGWMDTHDIREDRSSVSVSSEMGDKLNLQLKALLEKDINEDEPRFIQMMKALYESCTDLASIERAGGEPLKKVLKYLGGWPVVEGNEWKEAEFDWINTVIGCRRLGCSYNTLLLLYVAADERNNTNHIIQLEEPGFGIDRVYILRGLSDSTTAAYFKKMVDAAKLLGADEETVENELLKAFQFEAALAKFSLPREEKRDVSKLYNKFTVDELQRMVPKIPWLEYFNGLLSQIIDGKEPLIVENPDFIIKFADLISNTDKRVVANYMMWRVVDDLLTSLSRSYRDLDQQFRQVATGTRKVAPRWNTCVNAVRNALDIALGSYYVRHHFSQDSKAAALEEITYIQNEFRNSLDGLDWMDENTKRHAREKADAFKMYVGYPDELLNDTAVMEVYKNLSLTDTSFFENIISLQKWSVDRMFQDLRKRYIKGEWKNHAGAAVVNAYYYLQENLIEIPAGILQNPLFDNYRPQYMNFGATGYTIGHEITHGFDDEGSQYDKDGNNVNWWDQATRALFKEKVQCIIDQYSNYTVEDNIKVNGFNTQGENIADIGGLKQAYSAYRSWVKDHGSEPRLPGLKYSQNQLFWISAAYSWCNKERPEIMKLYALTSSHSPDQFRVIGPMSNLPEFSEDFNCPTGAPMNRKNKCRVW